jgi:hypothetical protein
MLQETVEVMTEVELAAFLHKLEAFRYSLTEKECARFDAILKQSNLASGEDSGFDESVWLAAYAD